MLARIKIKKCSQSFSIQDSLQYFLTKLNRIITQSIIYDIIYIQLKNCEIISYQWIFKKKKIYGVEQNHMQKAFKISKLNNSAFVKRFASIGFHHTIKFIRLVTLDCTRVLGIHTSLQLIKQASPTLVWPDKHTSKIS